PRRYALRVRDALPEEMPLTLGYVACGRARRAAGGQHDGGEGQDLTARVHWCTLTGLPGLLVPTALLSDAVNRALGVLEAFAPRGAAGALVHVCLLQPIARVRAGVWVSKSDREIQAGNFSRNN